ncbi:MAG TPA: hypothetical protein VK604_09655 [Bryobacteraceae bacterium]|nr:hypothetical protein [Bryobacteraceae bacterium]
MIWSTPATASPVDRPTRFVRIAHAHTNPVYRLNGSLSLHALDICARFQNLPGSLDARSNQLSGRDSLAPAINLREIASHVPHTRDSVGNEQRKREHPRLGEVDMGIPKSRNEELLSSIDDQGTLWNRRGHSPNRADSASLEDYIAVHLYAAVAWIDHRYIGDHHRLATADSAPKEAVRQPSCKEGHRLFKP